jgi:hypothetical protein
LEDIIRARIFSKGSPNEEVVFVGSIGRDGLVYPPSGHHRFPNGVGRHIGHPDLSDDRYDPGALWWVRPLDVG